MADVISESNLPYDQSGLTKRTRQPSAIDTFEFYYSDINSGIETNNLPFLLYDNAAIFVQIGNVLETAIGSDPFEPEFGSELPLLINEQMSSKTAWRLETATFRALNRWMADRLTVLTAQARFTPMVDEQGGGYYDVYIPCIIKKTKEKVVFKTRYAK